MDTTTWRIKEDDLGGPEIRALLETGSGEPFAAAVRLYSNHGFVSCGPFGDYQPDPFSQFMTLRL
jgi:putative acetyltransferase